MATEDDIENQQCALLLLPISLVKKQRGKVMPSQQLGQLLPD